MRLCPLTSLALIVHPLRNKPLPSIPRQGLHLVLPSLQRVGGGPTLTLDAGGYNCHGQALVIIHLVKLNLLCDKLLSGGISPYSS